MQLDIFDLPALAAQQKIDPESKSYPNLKSYNVGNDTILCDISSPFPRPFVPKDSRKSIFNSLHNISHPGINATTKLVKARYFWPSMDKDIRNWSRECLDCQKCKVQRHTKTEVQKFDIPTSRFEAIHIDIVGPLTPVNYDDSYTGAYRYLLTCIAAPMKDVIAATVAITFLNTWI